MNKEEIAVLICKKLKKEYIYEIMPLLLKMTEKEKTKKSALTKTPFLISIGEELGKLLITKAEKIELLKELWKISYSKKRIIFQGTLAGREIRLIIIGALSKISKKEYQQIKEFVCEIAENIYDWETCDQLALKVVVNLAIQEKEEIFRVLKSG
jgi:hypothetical protein